MNVSLPIEGIGFMGAGHIAGYLLQGWTRVLEAATQKMKKEDGGSR